MQVVRLVLRWCARLTLGFVLVTLALVTLYHYVAPPLTPLMVLRVIEGVAPGSIAVDPRDNLGILFEFAQIPVPTAGT